jgi:uncharacterized protein
MKNSLRYSLLCGALLASSLGPELSAGEPAALPPLTTVPHSPRLPGKFVWADLVTDNVAAARTFYGPLFGWTFREADQYTIVSNDERPLCGIVQRPRPADGSARPRWFGYLSVPSVEKALRAATEAGGRVLAPPQKFPRRGEQAVFADPEGAVFGVLKSSSGDPPDFLPDPGDWIWIQLLSRDAGRAATFYRTVGGYEVIENTASNRMSDCVLTSEGFARATIRSIPKERESVPPTWLPFVRVKSAAASAAQAKQLGGSVLIEPAPELFDGKVAVIADPSGAAIGIMEWNENLSKGAQ